MMKNKKKLQKILIISIGTLTALDFGYHWLHKKNWNQIHDEKKVQIPQSPFTSSDSTAPLAKKSLETHPSNLHQQEILSNMSQTNSREPASEAAQDAPVPWFHKKKKLQNLFNCLKNFDCPYPQENPQSYHYSATKGIVQEINNINLNYFTKENFIEIKPLLLSLLNNEEGHLQEAALRLAITQAADNEILNSLINGLYLNVNDPDILKSATQYFSKFMENPNIEDSKLGQSPKYLSEQTQILEFFNRTLKDGSQLVSSEAASQVKYILRDHNYGFFKNLVQKLDSESVAAKNLQNCLRKYSLYKSGG